MSSLLTTASEKSPLSSIPGIIGDPKLKDLASVQDLASAAVSRGKELYQASNIGSASLRTLVIVTGLALSITSSMDLITSLLSLHFSRAILDLYCTVFGVVAVLIESDKDKNPFGARRFISTYFHFLDYANGKSAFYFFLGTLKIAQVCV